MHKHRLGPGRCLATSQTFKAHITRRIRDPEFQQVAVRHGQPFPGGADCQDTVRILRLDTHLQALHLDGSYGDPRGSVKPALLQGINNPLRRTVRDINHIPTPPALGRIMAVIIGKSPHPPACSKEHVPFRERIAAPVFLLDAPVVDFHARISGPFAQLFDGRMVKLPQPVRMGHDNQPTGLGNCIENFLPAQGRRQPLMGAEMNHMGPSRHLVARHQDHAPGIQCGNARRINQDLVIGKCKKVMPESGIQVDGLLQGELSVANRRMGMQVAPKPCSTHKPVIRILKIRHGPLAF